MQQPVSVKLPAAHAAVGINADSGIVCLYDPRQDKRIDTLRNVLVGTHIVIVNAVARRIHIVRP